MRIPRNSIISKVLLTFSALLTFNASAEITFTPSTFQNLDYGLYWFGYNEAEKAVPGQLNPYYENHKPTMIFIHGWQQNSVTNQRRETFNRQRAGEPDEDLSQYWLDRGYNVGILYWNQFADEGEVKDAEAKMWSINGPRKMRWKALDGQYRAGPNRSVGQLLFESVRDNMADFSNGHLRLAGHSLGNQLALIVGKKLHDAVKDGLNPNLRPDRIALLDGFYSRGWKDYLGRWTGEHARLLVDILKADGVILEAYRSSGTSSTGIVGDKNVKLWNKTAFTELRPWNFNGFQFAEKHNAAVTWYFWSMAFDVPQMIQYYGGGDVMSSATGDNRARELMNANFGTRQYRGKYSATPADDDFERRGRQR